MNKITLSRVTLLSGILALILAVIIAIFADGLRRYYSSIFFAFMGIVLLLNARHQSVDTKEQSSAKE